MGFGEKIVKCRHLIMVVSLILLIPSFFGMQATRINYDMLTYLPKNIDTVKGQDLLLKDFHKGGFSIVVTENMKKNDVREIADKIKDVKHVTTVKDLNEVIDPSVPRDMYPEKVRKNLKNKNASMIVVFFDTATSAEGTLDAIKEIRGICTKDCYVSGMSAMVTDMKNLCEAEEVKYVGIAVALSLVAMMLLLDSFAAPFIFLASIGMAILYNLGSNVMLGEISYITKAIAAVLQLGVTMDYSIFLWHSYMENLDKGYDDKEAMARGVDETLVSVTGSSITTVAGFLALCFMSYTMGKDLGIVMAKGVVLGVISSVTILPTLMLYFNKLLKRTRHRSLIPDMTKVARGLTSRYGVYLVIFGLMFIPAIYGYMHENIVYDMTKMLSGKNAGNIAEKAPFLEANDKLKEDFNIGTTHMIIADANLPVRTSKDMTEAVSDVKGVQSVLGIDSFVGTSIPRSILPEEATSSMISKNKQLIMVNSEYKVSTDECNDQIDEINNTIDKYDRSAKLIGEGPATKDLIQITDKDFKVVSFISIAAVFVIILIVLKSWVLPILLVAAIEFAIYVNLGIPGFTGLELPFIVPVCISTIQLGSTVDYAILLSTRYKLERKSGNDKRTAVEIAAKTSIPSIIVSALGFFTATFGVGLYSDIGIISTFCNLMARGAIISMFTVILVLPSLLMAFDTAICKTTKGLRNKDLKTAN